MKKNWISFVAIIAIIALMCWTVFNGLNLGFAKIPSAKDGVVLGLDLVGGSEITYQAVVEDNTSAEDLTSGMEAAKSMLRQRLTSLGYTEASVYLSGTDSIVVDIPNVDDPEKAVQLLGTTAKVEFKDADGNVVLDGTDIKSAYAAYSDINDDGFDDYHVVLELTSDGQAKFTETTKTVAQRPAGENYIEIMMDNEVLSAPYVESKYASTGIDSDKVTISLGNNATMEYSAQLANLISAGQLPFSLQNTKLQAISATLGVASLRTSMLAGMIGLAIILIFMLVIYRIPGLAADISLLFYATLVVIILSVSKINLSLPGIAGIILSIGMAVDANVIIFERIKEELCAGKTLRSSIDAGFKRAFTAIVDSNITTAIAALCLWWQGTGTIVGFAKTLLIGVIVSMFTMLIITRILINNFVGFNIKNIKAYGA